MEDSSLYILSWSQAHEHPSHLLMSLIWSNLVQPHRRGKRNCWCPSFPIISHSLDMVISKQQQFYFKRILLSRLWPSASSDILTKSFFRKKMASDFSILSLLKISFWDRRRGMGQKACPEDSSDAMLNQCQAIATIQNTASYSRMQESVILTLRRRISLCTQGNLSSSSDQLTDKWLDKNCKWQHQTAFLYLGISKVTWDIYWPLLRYYWINSILLFSRNGPK